MNIEDLLDVMDETIEGAFTVPLSGKRMVDAEKLQDIISDVRLNMPEEIRKARVIVQDRSDIVASAQREADNIIKKAEERARVLVSQEEIVKQSQAQAAEIVSTAQQRAKELNTNVTGYCESLLKQTEEQLATSAADVKKVRSSLRQKGGTTT